jgi:hypothetical protein
MNVEAMADGVLHLGLFQNFEAGAAVRVEVIGG